MQRLPSSVMFYVPPLYRPIIMGASQLLLIHFTPPHPPLLVTRVMQWELTETLLTATMWELASTSNNAHLG